MDVNDKDLSQSHDQAQGGRLYKQALARIHAQDKDAFTRWGVYNMRPLQNPDGERRGNLTGTGKGWEDWGVLSFSVAGPPGISIVIEVNPYPSFGYDYNITACIDPQTQATLHQWKAKFPIDGKITLPAIFHDAHFEDGDKIIVAAIPPGNLVPAIDTMLAAVWGVFPRPEPKKTVKKTSVY